MEIDLNCDMGESFACRLGDGEALMALITSANVAAGITSATCW